MGRGRRSAAAVALPGLEDAAPRFRVLVADPPWKFNDHLPGRGRGAAKHYPCMSSAEICAFPTPPMLDDAVLFLWRVAAMQREAMDVIDAWGFTFKSELVWVKRTATGRRHFGMGRIVRSEHEVCLIATRGRPRPLNLSTRSTFEAVAVRQHSAKPDRFYDVVRELYEGPYVELFARRHRPGWTCFGNELDVANPEQEVGR